MCNTATPEDKQVLCSRCGEVCNPSDSWKYDWPNYGTITLGASSVINWALLRRVGMKQKFDYTNHNAEFNRSIINEQHPAVEKFGFQEVKIKWSSDSKYRLCWDCQQELIETIGEFFFSSIPDYQPIQKEKAKET